jgi:hypothetical protein
MLVVMAALGFVCYACVEASAQSDQDIRHLLKRLEENADRFRNSLDHALDHSSLNGSRTEDEINDYVHDFEKATDRLKHDHGKHGSDPDNAREVLLRGRTIECFMRKYDLGIRAKGDWQVVRNDLDAWERFYGFAGAGALHNQYPANHVAWRSNLPCDPATTHVGSSHQYVQKTTHPVKATRVRTSKPACHCPSSSNKGH